jgi:hypothetical protein
LAPILARPLIPRATKRQPRMMRKSCQAPFRDKGLTEEPLLQRGARALPSAIIGERPMVKTCEIVPAAWAL